MIVVLIIVYGVIFGQRNGYILSTDYNGYVEMYDSFPDDFMERGYMRVEPLFGFLIVLAKSLFISAEVFIFLIALVFHLLLGIFAKSFSRYSVLFFLMMTVTSFYFNFASNTVRQGLALSFFLVGLSTNSIWIRVALFTCATLIHFSLAFLVLFFTVSAFFSLKERRFRMLFILIISPVLFVLNPDILFNSLGQLLILFDIFDKAAINFGSDETITTGRMFYIFSYVVVLVTIVCFKRIKLAMDNGYINSIIYLRAYNLVFISVLMYPLFSQYSIFVRVISCGFFLSPLMLCVIAFAFLGNKLAVLFSFFVYVAMSGLLLYQMDYIL